MVQLILFIFFLRLKRVNIQMLFGYNNAYTHALTIVKMLRLVQNLYVLFRRKLTPGIPMEREGNLK